MISWERFDSLVKQAQGESVPVVDVVSAVRLRLAEVRSQPATESEWFVFAAASLAAAACVLVFSLPGWDLLVDPLVVFFQPLGDTLP